MQAGEQYGRLTLLALAGMSERRQRRWLCRCTCGKEVLVWQSNLTSGHSRSCGCLQRELLSTSHTIHGETAGKRNSPEYNAWRNLLTHHKVCPRWRASFAAFLADVGRRPSPQHVLVHTKPGRLAGPGLVAWASRREVAQERFARRIQIGRESHTVREWGRIVGLSHAAIYKRLAQGWSAKQAIFTPASPGRHLPRSATNQHVAPKSRPIRVAAGAVSKSAAFPK
jgi:hypothetical protein